MDCQAVILIWAIVKFPGFKVSFYASFDIVLGKRMINFYAPVSKDRGHILFGLSVCLSVCKKLSNWPYLLNGK